MFLRPESYIYIYIYIYIRTFGVFSAMVYSFSGFYDVEVQLDISKGRMLFAKLTREDGWKGIGAF